MHIKVDNLIKTIKEILGKENEKYIGYIEVMKNLDVVNIEDINDYDDLPPNGYPTCYDNFGNVTVIQETDIISSEDIITDENLDKFTLLVCIDVAIIKDEDYYNIKD